MKIPRTFGAMLILAGAMWLFMVWAFASMVDPSLEGWARQREIWGKFLSGDGPAALCIGLGLIVPGLWIAAGGGGPRPRNPGVKTRLDDEC